MNEMNDVFFSKESRLKDRPTDNLHHCALRDPCSPNFMDVGLAKPLKPLMASSAGHCWSEGLGGRGGFIHRLGAAGATAGSTGGAHRNNKGIRTTTERPNSSLF